MGEVKYTEIDESLFKRGLFEQECDGCGQPHQVKTQQDDSPEYYTTVYTYCNCGQELEWELPVN